MEKYADEMVVACFVVFIKDGQQQNSLPLHLLSVGNKLNN